MMLKKFIRAFICIMLLSLAAQASCYVYDFVFLDKPGFTEQAAAKAPNVPANTEPAPKKRVIPRELSELIVVNKTIRLTKEYEPNDLTYVKGVYLRKTAGDALAKMLKAAAGEGINNLVAISGYRSYATQEAVYYNKIARLKPDYGDGAEQEALKLVAPPGASEHQTGLAVDFTLTDFLDYEYVLNYDFGYTQEGRWLQSNAWKYGFILRYPEDKEVNTGFSYEPWHFRYVGAEHAKAMFEEKLCLEEYMIE